jgi:hypothetical protein
MHIAVKKAKMQNEVFSTTCNKQNDFIKNDKFLYFLYYLLEV